MTGRSSLAHGLLLALLCALLTANYLTNFAGIAEGSTFRNWQLNGQARVLGGIHADRIGIDKAGAHLGKVWPARSGPPDWGIASAETTYRIFANPDSSEPVAFEHYRQQYGLHETFYSLLARALGLDSLQQLQAIPAFLTALTVTLLFAAFLRLYGVVFAVLFLFVMSCAPLFLTMARNLYWSPYLLFLPALVSSWMYEAKSKRGRQLLLVGVWLAMLAKCLSNYEYITSVTLLACAVFLLAPLFADPLHGRPDYRAAVAVFAACVLAFAVAFLVHAASRGNGLMDGIRDIVLEDVMRRTYGDASMFSDETAESLRASPFDVLKIYLLDYPGKRTMLVPGKLFLAMIAFCIIGIGTRLALRERLARRDAWTFIVFLAVPVSWFVLAKGHSYTQTHINFVLWFIGFMSALLFVTWSTARALAELVRGRVLAPSTR